MSNPFLSYGTKDVATAKLYERAVVADLEKIFHTNAPALTNGKKIYLNTEDNLFKTLPNYNIGMLKWLLWHEQQHLNLKHHKRYYNYINELKEKDLIDKYHLAHDEVNIIMDILVHDSLCNWFPDLVETAKSNYAQMRNCNSLGYTFTTHNLEDMLDEYRNFKETSADPKDKDEKDGDTDEQDGQDGGAKKSSTKAGASKDEETKDKTKTKTKPPAETEDEEKDDEEKDELKSPDKKPDHHHDVDWDKAKEIDSKEFITEAESYDIDRAVQKIKRKKLKLAKITETVNGLATSQRVRTYAVPSKIQVGKGVILKGRKPGRAKLYLIFDASGSMYGDMRMFKEIITGAIPQAMESPCEWFSGCNLPEDKEASLMNHEPNKAHHASKYNGYYYKGKFKDFMDVDADDGYCDDGYRVLELCLEAEKLGYNPIGVTDGGANRVRSDEIDLIKKLKRTVIVGENDTWMRDVKKYNPAIQTICTDERTY